MAKKLKRVRRNPFVLLVELLMPWMVMGLVAVWLTAAGIGKDVTIAIALMTGLGVTGLVFLYERSLRRLRRTRRR